MAKVELKANTQDAQKKIQKLRQEIDKLDKQVKSPKKYNLQTKGLGVGSMAGGLGLGGRAMGMTVAAGSAIGGLAATALTKLVGVLSAAIPALLKFGLGIDNVNGLMKKWSGALESYSNAPEKALDRAMQMDALDDEKRAHGTKSVGEEVAWYEAYKSIAGNDFNSMLLTKFETLLEQVKSGDVNAIETVKQFDTMTGYTATGPRGEMEEEWAIANHLNKMNTYEFMTEMLKGYNAALAKGDYSKTDAMLKLVGNRGISAIRKLGDLSTLEKDKADIQKQWESVLPPEVEQKLLQAASDAEKQAAMAKVFEYAVPESGLKNVATGAQTDYDSKKLSFDTLGSNEEVVDSALAQMESDWNTIVDQAVTSPLGKAIKDAVVEQLKQYGEQLSGLIDNIGDLTETVKQIRDTNLYDKLIGEHIDAGLEWLMPSPDATEQLYSKMPRPSKRQRLAFGDNAYYPLVASHPNYEIQKMFEERQRLANPDNPVIQEMFNPETFNKRFWKSLREPQTKGKKVEEDKKQNQEVVTALKEVTTSLKTNANATNQMNQTMQKGLVVNGSTTGNSPAVFA